MLKFSVKEFPEADVVSVSGDVTGSNALLLVEQLARRAASGRAAVVDLSQTTTFHETALRSLRACLDVYRSRNQPLVVCAPPGPVRQTLEAAGLAVLATSDDALAAVRQAHAGTA